MNTNLEVLFLLQRLVLLHFSASIEHLLVRIDRWFQKHSTLGTFSILLCAIQNLALENKNEQSKEKNKKRKRKTRGGKKSWGSVGLILLLVLFIYLFLFILG